MRPNRNFRMVLRKGGRKIAALLVSFGWFLALGSVMLLILPPCAEGREFTTLRFDSSSLRNGFSRSGEGLLGVCSHLSRSYHWDNEFEVRDRTLELIKGLGLSWVRTGFPWRMIQPRPDSWKWENWDAVIASAKKHNFKILGVVHAPPEWAFPAHEHMQEWKTFLGAVVERYGDAISAWEIWNEPNVNKFWPRDAPVRGLFGIVRDSYGIIKSRQPNAIVLLGGMANKRNAFRMWKELMALGAADYFDGVAFHAYKMVGKDLVPFYSRLRSLVNRYTDEEKGIWITEYGWQAIPGLKKASHIKEATYKDHAVNILKTYLVHLAEGGDHFFIYEFRDDRRKKHYGIFEHDFKPKEAAKAVHWILNKLGKGFVVRQKQYFDDGALIGLEILSGGYYIATWGRKAYLKFKSSFLSRGKYEPETYENLPEKVIIEGFESRMNKMERNLILWREIFISAR